MNRKYQSGCPTLTAVRFGQQGISERVLKITIPESLDYDGLYDDIFRTYQKSYTLDKVKTTNMGTLYELQYPITLRGNQVPKAFLDALRCRKTLSAARTAAESRCKARLIFPHLL